MFIALFVKSNIFT